MKTQEEDGPFTAMVVEDDPALRRLYKDILEPDKRFFVLLPGSPEELTARLDTLQDSGGLIDLLLVGGELWPIPVPGAQPVTSTWRMWKDRFAKHVSKDGFVLGISGRTIELNAMEEFFQGQHNFQFGMLAKPFRIRRLMQLVSDGLGLSKPK